MALDKPELAQKILTKAKLAGADDADVLLVDSVTQSIEVRAGALEQAERAESLDVGLRVIVGQKQACVSVSETSEATLDTLVERAIFMANVAPDDASVGLASEDQLSDIRDGDALDLVDKKGRPSPEQLQDIAKTAEAAALSIDGVTQAQGAGIGYSDSDIYMAASNGFAGGYARSGFSLSCVAIAGEGTGMERDYAGEARNHFAELPDATEIGLLAGERAVARLGATQPKTGAYPVLFDERISSSLIGHLMAAINGSSIVRGSSWLLDAMGEQVLPKGMTLTEEPQRVRGGSSKPFDAEGLKTQNRNYIEDGVLQSWVLDLGNARKLGLQSTASASRGVSSPPSPRSGNLSLSQGDKSRQELLRDMGTGLWVTSMIGSTINPNTGDYSRGAAGYWVENGEPQFAVNECTIAGNLREMLGGMIAGNDARTHLSRVVPSLLVQGLTIAGN